MKTCKKCGSEVKSPYYERRSKTPYCPSCWEMGIVRWMRDKAFTEIEPTMKCYGKDMHPPVSERLSQIRSIPRRLQHFTKKERDLMELIGEEGPISDYEICDLTGHELGAIKWVRYKLLKKGAISLVGKEGRHALWGLEAGVRYVT